MSGLTGFIGMSLAVRGNVRTAAAARTGSLPAALKVAFRTGGVAGMFTVGLGLLGATVIIMAVPEHELGDPHRLRVRRLAARALPAGRRRHLHQGRRRRRRPRRQGRAGHPRGRPPQPGHDRRQRRRQRRRLRRHGRRPVRELRGHARRVDHPRRRGVRVDRADDPSKWVIGLIFPVDRPRHRRARVDRRRVRGAGHRQGQVGDGADQPRASSPPVSSPSSAPRRRARLRRQRPGLERRVVERVLRRRVVIGLVLAQVLSRLTEYFTSTETAAGPRDRRGGPHRPRDHGAVRHQLRPRVDGVAIVAIAIAHRRRPSASAAATSSSSSTSSP